jgi:D-mannonate dehydratase
MDSQQNGSQASRREFARLMAGGALGLAGLSAAASAPAQSRRPAPGSSEPGMKMGIKWRFDPSDDDLLFLRQIGVTHISATIPTSVVDGRTVLPTLAQLEASKARFESGGLKVHKFLGPLMVPAKEIVLALPGRDEQINIFKDWIELNGKVGLYYVGVSYMATGVWASGRTTTRGAGTREFDASAPNFQNDYKINEPAL